ncbi:MAG: N-acetylmuramoyl-L-alanine amidase [Flavobacteriales bacterium]|nr:N-acetylmuramoyl-L-alanine amidase [Flavobacteriales bacterium]
MRFILIIVLFLSSFVTISQNSQLPSNPYQQEFAYAYAQYPDVPRGVLEAVAFTMTRFHHIENPAGSCTGLPKTYGVMGLTLDGKQFFNNNLLHVSQVSGISVQDILNDPQQNILAFAAAYHVHLTQLNPYPTQTENITHVLTQLSELPSNNLQLDFALNSHLYAVLSFLQSEEMQMAYNFPDHQLNLADVFDSQNLTVLQSRKVIINQSTITSENGTTYKKTPHNKSVDYPPALWDEADPSNFSSRGTATVSAVTIHDVEGSYAGCIGWFNNPAANVSAHYVLRSSDGQVTQMVLESLKAWHVGSENPYTIGLEHEGYSAQTGWYTPAMYQSSADLVRDITQSGYGIDPLRTAYFPWAHTTNYNTSSIPGSCVTIKGHQHYPNQTHTDPGPNWDWKYYDNLINNSTPVTTITSASGTITDNGGSAGNYTGQRELILIQPANASSIILNTVMFDMENTWDYLYIYDGATTNDPLIGYYTGSVIPASITSSGGSMLLEMRADCATDAQGFEFNFTSTVPDLIPPTTAISSSPSPFATTDFTSSFTDADNVGGSGVQHVFYNVSDYNTTEWRANDGNGFFNDDFDVAIHTDWIDSSGVWSITANQLHQSDENNWNTNLYAVLDQNNNNKFLYHFKAAISGSGTNKRAGFHYMCDDASQTNRGNSYFIWLRQDDGKLQFYKVVNNTFTLEKDVVHTFNAGQQYDYKIIYDKTTGTTDVYVDDTYIDSWTDASPYTSGNAISFRSGNCVYDVDELRVYKDRSSSALIKVGSASTNDIRYENNPSTSGMIRSLAIDSAHNISTIAVEMVDVDFTTTGVEKNAKPLVRVFPNPTQGILHVFFHQAESGQLIITDLIGQQVKVQRIQNQRQVEVDVTHLPSGIYLLNFGSEQVKIIKQ